MTDEERFSQALRAERRRLTRQRRLVMDILNESNEHLDAETLYSQAKARDPNIGLATVYRTLALLKDMGLVEEHKLGEEHAHFEAMSASPHYHFTCLACGRVIEFEAPQLQAITGELSEREGVRVTEVTLSLSGYCAKCK